MDPDEDGVYQLKGSDNVKGGLIIKKKAAPGTSVEFKVPKVSLLGLDRLAAEKRKEREQSVENEGKKSKITSYKDDDGEEVEPESPRYRSSDRTKRTYREAAEETPTHTGGISKEARDRFQERMKKDTERGVLYSTKNRDEDRNRHERERDKDSSRGRESERDRDYREDKYKKSSSRERHKDLDTRRDRIKSSESSRFKESSRDGDRESKGRVGDYSSRERDRDSKGRVGDYSSRERGSERSHRGGSERKYRDESERKLIKSERRSERDFATPSVRSLKDEPMTPDFRIKGTPSRSNWDDEDEFRGGVGGVGFPHPSFV
ncbi:hypothetical protein WDU94_003326 [Cyamophila willieti]